MILYKYRADSVNTVKIFTTKKVWLSTAEGLNDPFECEFQATSVDLRKAQVKQMKEAQLSGFLDSALQSIKSGTTFFGIPKNKTRSLLQEFKNLKNFDKSYAKFRFFISQRVGNPPSDPDNMFLSAHEQLAAVGVFSLSQVPDDPLMWAHYSGDHKGICIGFEITDDSILADSERCLRVEYQNSTPVLSEQLSKQLTISFDKDKKIRTSTHLAFSDASLKAAISTKGPEWQYEREWRYVEPVSGAYDWPAPIIEITFGLRCPKERRDFYINLVQQKVTNEVRFYEIKKVHGTKSLERIRLQVDSYTTEDIVSSDSVNEVQRLMQYRQFSAALLMIDRLLCYETQSAELWRCKGIALGWSEKHEEALECFENAINIDCETFSVWYQKGVALTQLERYEEAVSAHLRAQKLCSFEPSIAFNIGQILSHLKRFDEALVQLDIAAKLGHPRASDSIKKIKEYLSASE